MSFVKDFAWGVATASYQIEGGAYAADKGLNVWDIASRTPGRIYEGQSGDVACDHYNRMKEDIALMKKLGIKNYRLSINWARLIPNGTGKVSEAGKKFYTDLFCEMKKAGITPWVTLFHWDYPYELYLKGGWLNSESSAWFEQYASVCVELFGEYIENYILINEPQCFVGLGHYSGEHAPFLKLPASDALRCAHNVILACAKAEKVIRAKKPNAKIGIAQAFWLSLPYTEADYELAKNDSFACNHNFGSPALWADPLLYGKYPADYLAWMQEVGFTPPEEDMKLMKSKLDFMGLNTYTGNYITKKDGKIVPVMPKPSVPKTEMRWTVHPDSLYYGPKFIYEKYKMPIVYTENGVALTEWKTLEGEINDDCRIDYIKRYLRALDRAAKEVPIHGYFYWSFMDNFEWAEGFSKHFGLVHIDYDTQECTPKKSAYWYKKVIESNGEEALR